MLPLNVVSNDGNLVNPAKLAQQLQILKNHQVDGYIKLQYTDVISIMVDVWWGIVERKGPKMYDWKAYQELFDMCVKIGLKIEAVMSFHQCGGNV